MVANLVGRLVCRESILLFGTYAPVLVVTGSADGTGGCGTLAKSVGVVTLLIGIFLVAAPARVGRLLHTGSESSMPCWSSELRAWR
jgi:hypothetical protein